MKAVLAAIVAAVVFAIPASASTGGVHVQGAYPWNRSIAPAVRPGQVLHAPKQQRHVKRYQWLRCNPTGQRCARIPRATRRTYRVRIADVGHRLRVRMVIANANGSTVAVSDPTPTVGLPLPVNTALPTIAGTAQQGQTLTASPGTWQFAVRFTYQWEDCDATGANCVAIASATATTYTLQASDVGDTIRVVVTAYNFAQAGASADSRVA